MNMEREMIIEGHSHTQFCCKKGISWSAVVAGTLVGIGLGFLLNLFNIAIGLSAFTVSKEGLETLAVGGFIGLLIGTIVSMFAAGWVSGFVARHCTFHKRKGVLYGFATWTLILLVTAAFASHLGDFLDSYHFSITNTKGESMAAHANTNETQMSKNSPQRQADQNMHQEQTEKAVREVGVSLFITFFLFFIGALSSCIGGYLGVCHCKDEERIDNLKRV